MGEGLLGLLLDLLTQCAYRLEFEGE